MGQDCRTERQYLRVRHGGQYEGARARPNPGLIRNFQTMQTPV